MKKGIGFLSLLLALAMLVSMTPAALAEDAPMHISVAGYMFGPIDNDRDVVTPLVEKLLLEKHGINVDIEVQYIENSNYTDVLNPKLTNLSTAPDVFLANSATLLKTYYEQGVIKSWSMDFFKENAPDVYEFIMNGAAYGDLKNDVDQWVEASMLDGKMVTVPSFKPDGSMPYKAMIYRGDWLEKLGVTEDQLPTAIEEFVELMYRFAKEDPDGNGVDDTYGMSCTAMKALFGAYGMYEGFLGGTSYWMNEDGEITNPDVNENSKAVLELLAQMYADGVIDPEFVTGKEAISGSYWAISNGFVNGRYGVSALASIDHYRLKGVTSEADEGGPCAKEYWAVNGDDSTFVYGPWPAGPEGEYGYSVGYSVAVSESAVYNASMSDEKLATIFQIMNAFATDDELYLAAFAGIEGEHYTLNEDGTITRNPGMTNADLNAVGVWGCRSLYGADRAFSTTAYNLAYYNDPSIANRLNWFKKPQYDSYIQNAVSVNLPSQSDLMGELNTIRDEAWVNIITGKASLDSWDAYVASYNAAGGETLYAEANEWFNNK